MHCKQIGNYELFEQLPFDYRPKGDLLKLSVNPYNGKVYASTAKQVVSPIVALDIMRKVVKACDELESWGIANPLEYLMVNGSDKGFESLEYAAGVRIVEFEGGNVDGSDDAAEGGKRSKKAS